MLTLSRRNRWAAFVAGAGLASLLLVGCSDDEKPSGPSGPGNGELDLNAPNGGFTTSVEQPAFGDAELLAAAEAGDPSSLGDLGDLTDPGDPRSLGQIYAVTVRWGHLDEPDMGEIEDDGPGEATDWDGMLHVSRGGIALSRLLRFDPGDHLVLPRRDRQTLAWVSRIKDHSDGLRVLVHARANDGPNADSLSFVTGPFTARFALSELSKLDVVFDVPDGSGQQVSFTAFEVEPQAEITGFLNGNWNWLEGDKAGTFRGHWVSQFGGVRGFVQGIWGLNDEGAHVFFGKYITRDGAFGGFLRGTWDEVPGDPGQPGGEPAGPGAHARGTFQGVWLDGDENDPQVLGPVAGRFHQRMDGRGRFDGRWCFGCELN